MRVVVAMPVHAPDRLPMETGWPKNWETTLHGLRRQVGQLGNSKFAQLKVVNIGQDEGSIPPKSVSVEQAHYLELDKRQGLLITVLDVRSVAALDWLRRPGSRQTVEFFENIFGVHPDSSSTVYATAASEFSSIPPCADALLRVSGGLEKEVFAVRYSLLISAIAAERFYLDNATTQARNSKIDFLMLRSRRSLGWLKDWQEIPGSDSTSLLYESQALRESLLLDKRKTVVIRALENRVRSFDLGAGAALAAFGITQSSLANLRFEHLQVFQELGIALAVAFVTGFVTWRMVKN